MSLVWPYRIEKKIAQRGYYEIRFSIVLFDL